MLQWPFDRGKASPSVRLFCHCKRIRFFPRYIVYRRCTSQLLLSVKTGRLPVHHRQKFSNSMCATLPCVTSVIKSYTPFSLSCMTDLIPLKSATHKRQGILRDCNKCTFTAPFQIVDVLISLGLGSLYFFPNGHYLFYILLQPLHRHRRQARKPFSSCCARCAHPWSRSCQTTSTTSVQQARRPSSQPVYHAIAAGA